MLFSKLFQTFKNSAMTSINKDTPLVDITVGQLLEIIEQKAASKVQEPKDDRVGIDEIKLLTGLSKSQIYKLSMLNAIPNRKFGRKLVFSIKQVTEWMEQQTTAKETSKQKAARQLAKLAMKRAKNG
jgi:predicted DNA-binding transcriptional regulator AlpA